jgi:hypothetical protein
MPGRRVLGPVVSRMLLTADRSPMCQIALLKLQLWYIRNQLNRWDSDTLRTQRALPKTGLILATS